MDVKTIADLMDDMAKVEPFSRPQGLLIHPVDALSLTQTMIGSDWKLWNVPMEEFMGMGVFVTELVPEGKPIVLPFYVPPRWRTGA